LVDAREVFEGISKIEVKSAVPGWTCLQIAPDIECKEKVVGYFRSQLADLPGELCEKLGLAMDELLGNAIEHGCRPDPSCGVEFTFIRTHRMVLFQIRDAGPGFSIGSVPHAAVNNPPEDPLRHIEFRSQLGMRPGGYGIMLVKQIADELLYNEFGNEVLFLKYLDGCPAHGNSSS
jgi:anti-sigma regulatory factor (Ser/Thr protein kinase)